MNWTMLSPREAGSDNPIYWLPIRTEAVSKGIFNRKVRHAGARIAKG